MQAPAMAAAVVVVGAGLRYLLDNVIIGIQLEQ
jgi:hypothetical protein